MYVDRETLIYPSVLAGTLPGDPMGPREAPAFATFVTNNQQTVLRGYVYWYVPEDGTTPVLIIEMDDEDTGPDIADIKVRVRRNDGMVYEGTQADQVTLEEVD